MLDQPAGEEAVHDGGDDGAPGEAIYRIEVVDFPAFILVDDKGNDFFGSR